VTNLERRC